MSKRPMTWQLEKARTAKGLRDYPRCEEKGCASRGMGWIGRSDPMLGEFMLLWVCPHHAAENGRRLRAQRADAPRES